LINNHLNPGCLFAIAKGTQGMDANGNPQGHKDAEAFAMYAMGKCLDLQKQLMPSLVK
jgi:hypothetical protein